MTERPAAGLPTNEPSTWLVLALSGVFVALGLLFLVAPHFGARLFGIPAPEGIPALYLPVIGLRDLAFGLYLFALARTATRRVVALIVGITILIPLGDIFLVAIVQGLGSPWHLLLHGFSGGVLAFTAAWLLAQARHQRSGSNV
jgi:hypothetical protein